MKRTFVTKILITMLVGTSLTCPAWAILGVGDIVFDPSNYAQALQRLYQLQQHLAQLIQIYQRVNSQYQQMMWMARTVPVNMSTRYRALLTPWLSSSAGNTYGTTSGWIAGINHGLDTSGGYLQSTQRLLNYGPALGNIPADQLPRVKTNYATVELTDGANLYGMQTIGDMRSNAAEVENAIQDLEDDSLSDDPEMNTEIAVLNKISAANLITVRNTQDANKLLVSLAEQRVIEAKRTRDAEAQAINNHIRFMTDGRAVLTSQSAGASAAMLAWRMP
jgi:hypothetical protein